MSGRRLDTYLQELARALRERREDDPRLVDEVRDHLVDAIEDGVRGGLTRDDAEREALERFGPPEVTARQSAPSRPGALPRAIGVLSRVVHQWRWITAATAMAALVTSAGSYYWLPTIYRSESVIRVVRYPPAANAAERATRESRQRLQFFSQTVLNRTRLEWIAKDFGLDTPRDEVAPAGDAVQQIRRNIGVEVLTPEQPDADDASGVYRISFQAPDPRLAMRVTERIAALFVEENLRQHESVGDGGSQLLDSEIIDVRFRLSELESQVNALRAQNGASVRRADLIPFEVLQDRYRALLVRREEARSEAAARARGLVGDQFRIVEAARVPDRPLGPSRASVNLSGTLAGLVLAVAAQVWRRTG